MKGTAPINDFRTPDLSSIAKGTAYHAKVFESPSASLSRSLCRVLSLTSLQLRVLGGGSAGGELDEIKKRG